MQEDSSYAVIVVTHDHVGTLPACLDAVAALEPPPVEIVVIDNASSDGSAELVEARTDTGLRLIRERVNTGFAAAVNRGLRRDFFSVDPAAQPGLRTETGFCRADVRRGRANTE